MESEAIERHGTTHTPHAVTKQTVTLSVGLLCVLTDLRYAGYPVPQWTVLAQTTLYRMHWSQTESSKCSASVPSTVNRAYRIVPFVFYS